MKHAGTQTFVYESKPHIRAAASIVGPKEGEGPLGGDFDRVLPDDLLGQNTWEQAESELMHQTIRLCMQKGGLIKEHLGALFAGDLLNQITASGFAGRQLGTPFFGLYGACSTMIEGMVLSSALVDAGFLPNAIATASSHFCSAERQFRYPLELGNQRPPSAQWTATAAGAVLIDSAPVPALARVKAGTIGRVVDYQITDANHMGAAMAPAVADTLRAHFDDMSASEKDFDLIVTGDLGCIGRDILMELLKQRGIKMPDEKLVDCGASLYSEDQDTHAGGSGCGCIASVLSAHFLPMMKDKKIRRLLALGSGAMLSPTSSQQGESIPSISYAISLEVDE